MAKRCCNGHPGCPGRPQVDAGLCSGHAPGRAHWQTCVARAAAATAEREPAKTAAAVLLAEPQALGAAAGHQGWSWLKEMNRIKAATAAAAGAPVGCGAIDGIRPAGASADLATANHAGALGRRGNEQLAAHDAKWEAQLARLVAYKVEHGNFNVPLRWTEDLKLGSWVMHQRGGKRKLDRGDPCEGMTVERAARLTALGFAWEPPSKNNGWEGKNN